MKRSILAAIALLTASAAHADEITLSQPLAGASLHDAGVDMSVYWTEAESGLEVVATYAVRDAAFESHRLVMVLNDGDKVSFGLPQRREAYYTFSRIGDVVSVQAESITTKVASR
ncbi:MAG: hypothetical protein KTR21_16430 [Rhodobacteraceae bacterium]|nr:hypothetical protein [Paracoccaceae bacterium]